MYKSSILVSTAAFVMCATLLTFVFADDVERRQIVAVRIETPPKIDGRLDDPIWDRAQPSEGFIQNDPDRGEPMTEHTVIRILYDDENMYLGFQFYDSEPEKVIATETRRDSDGVCLLTTPSGSPSIPTMISEMPFISGQTPWAHNSMRG